MNEIKKMNEKEKTASKFPTVAIGTVIVTIVPAFAYSPVESQWSDLGFADLNSSDQAENKIRNVQNLSRILQLV